MLLQISLINPITVTFRGRLCSRDKHSIKMKTILSLVTTLALIIGAASLDASKLDAGSLFSALAVAALFAFALNDVRRPPYQILSARITRFPGPARVSTAPQSHSMDLAA